ncbi:GTPase domain-containing protein [Desulfatiglans anilini]|uniref:GTPase domain-containing protein n=1 Tax=Desulfatiglans anilini TaxID=90728 RepID=UPI000419722B|nr:GTPase domain-containing protein [Desulfatiglans anilini]
MESLITAIRAVRHPGLIEASAAIPGLAEDLGRQMAVIAYKSNSPVTWVMFLGGTGTGKSTLFNLFCGRALSATGVERPKTFGPIAYAHAYANIGTGFPFPEVKPDEPSPEEDLGQPMAGAPGRLSIISHRRKTLSHLAIVDTPDVDSVEEGNRVITRNLYLLADAIIFVASPEKYADEVPLDALFEAFQDGKVVAFLLNKVRSGLGAEDVLKVLESRGIACERGLIRILPAAPGGSAAELSALEAVSRTMQSLHAELDPASSGERLRRQQDRRLEHSRRSAQRLLGLLQAEASAAAQWQERLEQCARETADLLLEGEAKRFKAQSDEYIRIEIRKLFNRYDPLAKPRRVIQETILFPLRLLGFRKDRGEARHKQALAKLRKYSDSSPLAAALAQMNRRVLEELAPAGQDAPLGAALRSPDLPLTEPEIEARILQGQETLLAWIDERFRDLAEHLSTRKKWGIYSASIVWGALLLAVEIVIGGGFTMIDAVLDSALAPFLTKGTTELFAYQEIQKIARELADRYRSELLAVIDEQRMRYEQCLAATLTPPETVQRLDQWLKQRPRAGAKGRTERP